MKDIRVNWGRRQKHIKDTKKKKDKKGRQT